MPDVDLRIPVNINGRGCKAHEVLTGSALGARMIGCRVNLGGKDHQVNTWLLKLIGGGELAEQVGSYSEVVEVLACSCRVVNGSV